METQITANLRYFIFNFFSWGSMPSDPLRDQKFISSLHACKISGPCKSPFFHTCRVDSFVLLSSFTCLEFSPTLVHNMTLCFALFITICRHVVLIAKCLAAFNRIRKLIVQATNRKLEISSFFIIIFLTCHPNCFEKKARITVV